MYEQPTHDIYEFARQYLSPFRIVGREIRARTCPYCRGGPHGDLSTFTLNMDTGAFLCHRGTCGAKGGIYDLAEHLHVQPPETMRRAQSFKPGKQWSLPSVEPKPRTEQIESYFEKRCISKETLDAFQISADDLGNILFPFYRDGSLIYVKYRKPQKHNRADRSPKEWQERGCCPILFGMDLCVPDQPIVITEGQIDCMALYEAGVRNVVSVPSGCDNMDWIEPCWEWLEKFKTIILFGDNDPPGKKMVDTLVKRLGEDRCKTIDEYPLKPDGEECKDANEILYFCGPLELVEMVEAAREVPIHGIIDIADIVPRDPTTLHRIKTMIPALDESLGGLEEGTITVFTGKPGSGKTTASGLFLLNAIEQGDNVCAYSGELTKEKFQEWICLQAAGSDWITLKYDPVKGKKVPIVPPDVQSRILDWLRGHFFIYDNQEIFDSNQSDAILKVFTIAARRYGAKLFLLDNVMTALSDSDEETAAQGRFCNALKRFALRYGAHVIIVAHPRKTKYGEQIRQDDVGGNSAIVRLANSAVVVEKPNLRVIKARDAGLTRLIECVYCGDSRRVYQADKGDLNKFSWNKENLIPPLVRADSMPEYGTFMAQQTMFA